MAKNKLAEPVKQEDSNYDKYAVKHACETLKEAEHIKQDPKMMKLVQEYMNKESKAVKSIQDLRDLANKEDDVEEMEEEDEE